MSHRSVIKLIFAIIYHIPLFPAEISVRDQKGWRFKPPAF